MAEKPKDKKDVHKDRPKPHPTTNPSPTNPSTTKPSSNSITIQYYDGVKWNEVPSNSINNANKIRIIDTSSSPKEVSASDNDADIESFQQIFNGTDTQIQIEFSNGQTSAKAGTNENSLNQKGQPFKLKYTSIDWSTSGIRTVDIIDGSGNKNTLYNGNLEHLFFSYGVISKLGTGGGATEGPLEAKTKYIYKTTGNVIQGKQFYKDQNLQHAMKGGGSRPSVRFGIYHTKKTDPPCVPYKNYEVTVYVSVGSRAANASPNESRITVGGLGPGQGNKIGEGGLNGCVYHVGWTEKGKQYCEEECQHEPEHRIYQIKYTPKEGEIQDIGPIGNRILGLKTIFRFESDGTYVEGWVDDKNDGTWRRSYSAINPFGEKNGDKLPVIDRPLDKSWNDPKGLNWDEKGDPCQEVRFRCDNYWPVELIPEKSSIAEIVVPGVRSTE